MRLIPTQQRQKQHNNWLTLSAVRKFSRKIEKCGEQITLALPRLSSYGKDIVSNIYHRRFDFRIFKLKVKAEIKLQTGNTLFAVVSHLNTKIFFDREQVLCLKHI